MVPASRLYCFAVSFHRLVVAKKTHPRVVGHFVSPDMDLCYSFFAYGYVLVCV